jgi:hypothetical protein
VLVEFDHFENESDSCSNIVISASKYIRKMRGISQAVFIRANDGKHYVVKMNDNPAGFNLLANEHFGSVVAEAVGLPVVKPQAIFFSENFIDCHPDLWFALPSGSRRPKEGIHFGSPLVGQTSGAGRPTEYISPSRVNRIVNREAFLGMYLLDVWANHQDSRQAIFRVSSDNSLDVIFIDHGHMFGGPEWNFRDSHGCSLHLEMGVYTNLWQDEQIALWISRFQFLIPEVLKTIPYSIHPEWYKGNLSELIDRLTGRLASLPNLVRDDASRKWPWFQLQSIDETLRLADFTATRSVFHRGHAIA